MCGIAGIASKLGQQVDTPAALSTHLKSMAKRLAHRGPDGEGVWVHPRGVLGLAHRRLAIIDLTPGGAQPMHSPSGVSITFNGEIYNHIELRESLRSVWQFRSASDTEVILAAYSKWGPDCVNHLRGMFAFAIWDEPKQMLLLARDRFGIKPLYIAEGTTCLAFASEAQALAPLLPDVRVNPKALSEYLTFQYCLSSSTLVDGVELLPPGHMMAVTAGKVTRWRYWSPDYTAPPMTRQQAVEGVRQHLSDAVQLHMRADVPVGAYASGGVDSSIISLLASRTQDVETHLFHGRFPSPPGFDESEYARELAKAPQTVLHIADLGEDDFISSISDVIGALDLPVAGPGSFPQYHVSKVAARTHKVVLGGQGADEVFGGYVRYLIGAMEQALGDQIAGVGAGTASTIGLAAMLPNLAALNGYQPLMRQHFNRGFLGPLADRFFSLIDRSATLQGLLSPHAIDTAHSYAVYLDRFFSNPTIGKSDHFSHMTHFELTSLLPALLHVEDRMSMAHGLESRVPFLDHKLVEFVCSVPEAIRLEGGVLKGLLLDAAQDVLPAKIRNRRDKMGFPVPLQHWLKGRTRDFVMDVFASDAAHHRPWAPDRSVADILGTEADYSRGLWGVLSLELWAKHHIDKPKDASTFKIT